MYFWLISAFYGIHQHISIFRIYQPISAYFDTAHLNLIHLIRHFWLNSAFYGIFCTISWRILAYFDISHLKSIDSIKGFSGHFGICRYTSAYIVIFLYISVFIAKNHYISFKINQLDCIFRQSVRAYF